MIRKPLEKQKAQELRKQGKSIGEIAQELGISTSTVSLWVRNITLTTEQKKRLENKVFTTLQKGRIIAQEVQKQLRDNLKREISAEAVLQLGKLSKRDLFIAGIILYWTEGFKKDNRLGFANSDPQMVKLFLKWLYTLGVPKNSIRLRVGINISHKKRVKVIEKYWSKQTNIPLSQFQKPFFQKFIWKKEFPDPNLYHGVIRVRAINQGRLFIKILKWIALVRTSNNTLL
ncbi:MAG: Uncharacterized protein G01um10145_455 [Microgenomates group bacterium Gr01-1014_5]|nr:MAG: Uncharacterized protein G01um10145_455 [Microgenomates group bacterium Gr01-1014_5]